MRDWKLIGSGAGVLLCILLGVLLTSDHPRLFPLRNTLQYQLDQWWTEQFGASAPAPVGSVAGCITTDTGAAAVAARVLIAERDGTVHTGLTGDDGCLRLDNVPVGRYTPMVATADGFSVVAAPLRVQAGTTTDYMAQMPKVTVPVAGAGDTLRLGEPMTLTHPLPHPSSAIERDLRFFYKGRLNQEAFFYTPITATHASHLPVLLIVYPGPAAAWRGVSIPLAAAGYAVIATGPAYALDLEADIDELQRIVQFVRAGRFPAADARQIVLMGGSYSSLHVFSLLRRDAGFHGAVLLGPPTDLFELRRQFEAGSFFPPFGLDRALIALGYPDRQPRRFFEYSPRYHVRADLPPLLLLHSRTDEVVPFAQSELLVAELERMGVPHRAVFFDGLSHYLRADQPSPELDLMYDILLDFLDATLTSLPILSEVS